MSTLRWTFLHPRRHGAAADRGPLSHGSRRGRVGPPRPGGALHARSCWRGAAARRRRGRRGMARRGRAAAASAARRLPPPTTRSRCNCALRWRRRWRPPRLGECRRSRGRAGAAGPSCAAAGARVVVACVRVADGGGAAGSHSMQGTGEAGGLGTGRLSWFGRPAMSTALRAPGGGGGAWSELTSSGSSSSPSAFGHRGVEGCGGVRNAAGASRRCMACRSHCHGHFGRNHAGGPAAVSTRVVPTGGRQALRCRLAGRPPTLCCFLAAACGRCVARVRARACVGGRRRPLRSARRTTSPR